MKKLRTSSALLKVFSTFPFTDKHKKSLGVLLKGYLAILLESLNRIKLKKKLDKGKPDEHYKKTEVRQKY